MNSLKVKNLSLIFSVLGTFLLPAISSASCKMGQVISEQLTCTVGLIDVLKSDYNGKHAFTKVQIGQDQLSISIGDYTTPQDAERSFEVGVKFGTNIDGEDNIHNEFNMVLPCGGTKGNEPGSERFHFSLSLGKGVVADSYSEHKYLICTLKQK